MADAEDSFEDFLDDGLQPDQVAEAAYQQLRDSLPQLQDMTEEEAHQLRENVRRKVAQKLAAGFGDLHSEVRWYLVLHTAVWLLVALVIAVVVVFFGYKLYRSLKDKERRKEEKRRLKQQKKKK